MKNEPQTITEKDGPFSYSYIAILGVPGISLNEDGGDLHLFSFPDLGASACLTKDWDRYCQHIDRSSAIAFLMLTGFVGNQRFKKIFSWKNRLIKRLLGAGTLLKRNLDREEKRARLLRNKEFKSPGCYLIYEAKGELLEPLQLDKTKRVNRIGFGFDVLDGDKYRQVHRSALHGVATALSLLIDRGTGSPEINEIMDAIVVRGNDGLIVYPRQVRMGLADITVSRAPNPDDLKELAQYIPLITAERQIETAITLFVQSHRKDHDNLRAFIPAWSALELLINRVSKVVRPEFEGLLGAQGLPDWDKDLTGVAREEYRMRDRFYSVACTLTPEDARGDCETFVRANNLRSGFYHRNDVTESDLPTGDVRSLFRKYLALTLKYEKPNGGTR